MQKKKKCNVYIIKETSKKFLKKDYLFFSFKFFSPPSNKMKCPIITLHKFMNRITIALTLNVIYHTNISPNIQYTMLTHKIPPPNTASERKREKIMKIF